MARKKPRHHEKSITEPKVSGRKNSRWVNKDNSGANKGAVLVGPKGQKSYSSAKSAVTAAKKRSTSHGKLTEAARKRNKGAGKVFQGNSPGNRKMIKRKPR